MKWVTRVIALFVTVLFLFWYTIFGVGSVVTDLHGAITADIITGVAFGILVLTGYILSWWRERIGGILFLIVPWLSKMARSQSRL